MSLKLTTTCAFALIFPLFGVVQGAPSNSVTIYELTGSAQRRPVTISRVFAKGEIPHYPQASVAGTPLPTQADVKTRWPDGSVQHALISFVANLPKGGANVTDFVDQPSGNNTGALTAAQMLDTNTFNFGAEIDATNGATVTANARNMLSTGAFRYWLQGPICTQVIIEDRSQALTYDIGFDQYKPLHPIFVATFYPGFNSVKVEMILENMWTTKFEDVSYSLSLKTGSTLNTTVFSMPAFTHWAKSRWRKTYWSGTAPSAINIDYNFPYMVYSQALPNFDLTKVVSQNGINSELTSWAASDQGAFFGSKSVNGSMANGEWMMYMPTTGGRPDIGLFPRWVVRYLYTMDPRLYDVMMANAEVGGYVPIHYREGVTNRQFFDSDQDGVADTGNAFGTVVSIDARPTFSTSQAAALTQDAVTPVGTTTTGGWTPDLAHHGNFAYVPYLITGDWYLLEELQFWGSWAVANNNGTTGYNLGYIRHGNWGYFNSMGVQSRGEAWGMRSLSEAAFLSPDNTVEKSYFTQKLNYNIAVKEGTYNVTNGAFYQPNPGGVSGDPCPAATYNPSTATPWCWGFVTVNSRRANPLVMLDPGFTNLLEGLDSTQVATGESPWMWNYKQIVYGHIAELGFPMATLQKTIGVNLLHQVLDPQYNPFLTADYRIPVRDLNGNFFQNWGAVKNATLSSTTSSFATNLTTDVEHGYAHIARGATSFLTNVTDQGLSGQAAWAWMNSNVANQNLLNDNPKWAFVPRGPSGPAPTPSCDVNRDGTVNLLDVQAAIAQALGNATCTADLDQNGTCDVIDVQRVINAALGATCRIGP